MDHDTAGPAVIDCGGAVRAPAAAHQMVGTGGHRAHCVGTALGHRARIVIAHRLDHGAQALLKHSSIGVGQSAEHTRGAVGVVAVPDGEVAAAGAVAGSPYRTGIELVDPDIDSFFQLVVRQRPPLGGTLSQRAVQLVQRVVVANQRGAKRDFSDRAQRDLTGQEPAANLGQAIAQGQSQIHLPQRAAVSHRQRTRHLGGGGIPPVTDPLRMLAVSTATAHQLRDRRQFAGLRSCGCPRPVSDSVDQGRVAHVSDL